jgi:hypothetical protein
MKIRPKPLEYDAIVYDGDNADEVRQFCGAIDVIQTNTRLYVSTLNQATFPVNPGSYVVRKDGHARPGEDPISTISAEEFAAKFEEVPSEEALQDLVYELHDAEESALMTADMIVELGLIEFKAEDFIKDAGLFARASEVIARLTA